MNTRAYAATQGSVAWKVIEFLTTHPDECLSSEDIGVKFDKPAKQVHSFLAGAIDAGQLVRKEDLGSGSLVYVLGTGDPRIKPNRTAHPSLVVRAAKEEPRRRRASYFDVAEVKVLDDVPLPGPKNSAAPKVDWESLLARLTKPGQSFELPIEQRYAVAKQLGAYKRAHPGWDYTLRVKQPSAVIVWRTA